MTIYFSAAIAQADRFGRYYQRIIDALEKEGHTVFQDTTLVSFDEAVNKSDSERIAYYKQVLGWISKSDLVVLEVSFPSTLHIGHELSVALEKGRPVVALYLKNHEPSFFLGLENDKVFWGEYSDYDLEEIVREGMQYAIGQTETRYNLFLSSKHVAHLENRSRETKIPKSAYVRKLIEDDLEKSSS